MKRYCIFLLESELLHYQVKHTMFSAKYPSLQFRGELVSGRRKNQSQGSPCSLRGVEGFVVHRVRLEHIQTTYQDHS